jgi:hypothetical protein
MIALTISVFLYILIIFITFLVIKKIVANTIYDICKIIELEINSINENKNALDIKFDKYKRKIFQSNNEINSAITIYINDFIVNNKNKTNYMRQLNFKNNKKKQKNNIIFDDITTEEEKIINNNTVIFLNCTMKRQ